MARSRIALGLAVLLTVHAVYTHAAAVDVRRELLQHAPVGKPVCCQVAINSEWVGVHTNARMHIYVQQAVITEEGRSFHCVYLSA